MHFRLLIPVVLLFAPLARPQSAGPAAQQPPAVPPLPSAPDPRPPDLQGATRQNPKPNAPAEHSTPMLYINQREEDQSDDQLNPAMFLHHLIADRFWISGQSNFIFEAHGAFHSPYAGPNSFQSNTGQTALSRVLTLYTAFKLARWTEFVFDPEETGGKGVGAALGIAAYPNLDVVRNPTLSQNVYLARYFIHQTFPLTANRIEQQPNPFYLQRSIPARRMEFMMGKMSLVDFFDVNEVGSDPHLQFTNWAIDNNGGYGREWHQSRLRSAPRPRGEP
jgi:high affinity Mn2+ porin